MTRVLQNIYILIISIILYSKFAKFENGIQMERINDKPKKNLLKAHSTPKTHLTIFKEKNMSK